ncbi:hypothetical protein TRVL_09373 [Trypanosoma vivax]|nr:hypothetical protein TRVL_09373 [Trypanosoma vivax]
MQLPGVLVNCALRLASVTIAISSVETPVLLASSSNTLSMLVPVFVTNNTDVDTSPRSFCLLLFSRHNCTSTPSMPRIALHLFGTFVRSCSFSAGSTSSLHNRSATAPHFPVDCKQASTHRAKVVVEHLMFLQINHKTLVNLEIFLIALTLPLNRHTTNLGELFQLPQCHRASLIQQLLIRGVEEFMSTSRALE